MSDGLFFTVGLVFFFILWVASGGPTRPISFAGPFITPITNEGQTQIGYGPQLSLPETATISAVGGSVTAGERSATSSSSSITDTSPYAGQVILAHQVAGLSGTDPEKEYIEIELVSSAHSDVDISGWKVVSAVTGQGGEIPQGAQILKLGTISLQNIVLTPGAKATITTGASPVSVSFDENSCANYLSESSTYTQCVANESSSAGFLTGPWRIYLDETTRIWKNSDETVELVDSTGKIVDNFSY